MLLSKALKFLGMINTYMYKEIAVKMFKKGELNHVNNTISFWHRTDSGLLVLLKLFLVALAIYYDIMDQLLTKKA